MEDRLIVIFLSRNYVAASKRQFRIQTIHFVLRFFLFFFNVQAKDFTSMEPLEHAVMRKHMETFLNAMSGIVKRLQTAELEADIFQSVVSLGVRHYRYNAHPKYLKVRY
jgi:hypothetical protein